MKKASLALVLLLGASQSVAQIITVSDFNAPLSGQNFSTANSWDSPVDQLTVSAGILTIGPVSGGSPSDAGEFAYVDLAAPIDATGLMSGSPVITVLARIDAGNTALGFAVNFYDSGGIAAITSTFSVSDFLPQGSFTSAFSSLSLHPSNGDISDIVSFGIAGIGNGNALFRFSFDAIQVSATVIPEPSTYAAIIGLLALGYVAYRRRQLAA
jgi:hypothetical protein